MGGRLLAMSGTARGLVVSGRDHGLHFGRVIGWQNACRGTRPAGYKTGYNEDVATTGLNRPILFSRLSEDFCANTRVQGNR